MTVFVIIEEMVSVWLLDKYLVKMEMDGNTKYPSEKISPHCGRVAAVSCLEASLNFKRALWKTRAEHIVWTPPFLLPILVIGWCFENTSRQIKLTHFDIWNLMCIFSFLLNLRYKNQLDVYKNYFETELLHEEFFNSLIFQKWCVTKGILYLSAQLCYEKNQDFILIRSWN